MAAMAADTMNKVTSLESNSSIPSAPNATPATEFLESAVFEAPPPMDFAAVTNILAPITETLNESALEAMYPSPPINTPVLGSPSPSIKCRLPHRGRGFSVIGDRLAQLKIDNRKLHRHRTGTEVTSGSPSAEPSVIEGCGDCECDVASSSEVMSDDCKDNQCSGHESMSPSPQTPLSASPGLVFVSLGSPMANPRIEEYLSFTSKDLPTQAPAPVSGTTLAEYASITSTTALDGNGLHSRASFKSDGVTEKSNWAAELEESLDRTLLRLEQLAQDEHASDPSKSFEQYYVARLRQFLGDSKRLAPVIVEQMVKTIEKDE